MIVDRLSKIKINIYWNSTRQRHLYVHEPYNLSSGHHRRKTLYALTLMDTSLAGYEIIQYIKMST